MRHDAAPASGKGPDRSSLLLQDENNVRDPSKAKAISHEVNEEEYVDEDYEDDLELEQDPRSPRVLQDYENEDHNREKQVLNHTAHLHSINNKNSQKNNSTQQANHRVDPTSTQFDSYYYYDDYENDTHSAEGNFIPIVIYLETRNFTTVQAKSLKPPLFSSVFKMPKFLQC